MLGYICLRSGVSSFACRRMGGRMRCGNAVVKRKESPPAQNLQTLLEGFVSVS